MKHFLAKIVVFALVFALVDFAAGSALKAAYNRVSKGDCGRNNYMMKALKDKDILVFGSSRAIHQYNPVIIGKNLDMSCYNCGEDGMGIILSYARLNAILSRYTPKMIIYDFEKSYDMNEGDNHRYLGKLKPYYPDYEIDSVFNVISSTERFKMLSHLFRYNSQLVDIAIGLLSSSPDADDKYTYWPLMNTMDYEPEPQSVFDLSIDPIKMDYLCRFIDKCKEKNIRLIFTVSPTYHADCIDFQSILSKVTNNRQVKVLNHYSDSTFSAHKELFSDVTHLNKSGAYEYSTVISNEIKQMLRDSSQYCQGF